MFLEGVLIEAIDLINGRIHLGAARFLYAVLVVVAISTGLLLALTLLGASLPSGAPGRSAPLWEDVIAAGVAVAADDVEDPGGKVLGEQFGHHQRGHRRGV